jgi:type VI secretion system protein ImpC
VLDASRDELVEDLANASSLSDSALCRLVVDQGGDEPWSLLVDLTEYECEKQDAALLARLGTIAQQVDAAVLASMDWDSWSRGFASPDDELAWTDLRNLPAATCIAVALPNLLLRLPYGKGTDPIESFDFSEQTVPPTMHGYLWGSAALALAESLGQSYLGAGGWHFSPGDTPSIEDLPIHVSQRDEESVQTPCAQVWLPESKIDALVKAGLMPMVSVRGRGQVRISRFQSIASPPTALAGRWQSD